MQETSDGLLLKAVVSDVKLPLAEGLAAIRKRIGYKGAAVSVDDMHTAVLREAALRNKR